MKRLFLLPMALFALFAVVLVSCETEADDDVCDAFDAISEISSSCTQIPTVCCPIETGNCYYSNEDGDRYECDATLASENNQDGCNDAIQAYITANCGSGKMDDATHGKLVLEMSNFTRQMMVKARNYSVCY